MLEGYQYIKSPSLGLVILIGDRYCYKFSASLYRGNWTTFDKVFPHHHNGYLSLSLTYVTLFLLSYV